MIRSRARLQSAEPVPSTIYDREYFLSPALEGLPEYLEGGVSIHRKREVDLLQVQAGQRVLDLGCGRGEVAAELLRRGADVTALDYSWAAVVLTRESMDQQGLTVRADGAVLPFRESSFDRVLLSDVIEHLPWPLALKALAEVQRVLAPDGRALIHTAPNTWFIGVVKRPLVAVMRILGRNEVLGRFAEYDRLRAAMHPNELNPLSLRRLMRAAGLPAKTWVDRDVIRSGASEWTGHLITKRWFRLVAALAGCWPFRLVLGNDMYAVMEATAVAGTTTHRAQSRPALAENRA